MTRAIDVVRQVATNAKPNYLAAFEHGDALLRQHGINTPERLAHFLAQILHESGGLTLDHESMRYRAPRLMEIFGIGRHSAAITHAEADRLALDEQGIAERVYGLGNPRKAQELGNREPGDGFKYRGCGLMQTTGRSNYRRMSQLCGVNFEHKPDLVCSPEHALKPALAEWSEAGLNVLADQNDILAISRAINCGSPKSKKIPNGMQDRATWFAKVRRLIDRVDFKVSRAPSDEPLTPKEQTEIPRPELASESFAILLGERILRVGDEGPVVRALQLALAKLGYCLRGSGSFANGTLSAVTDFQKMHGLEVDGEVGAETAGAIDRALGQLSPGTSGPAIAALIGGRIVRIGAAGPIVQAAQLALARLGYPLQGTGNFGPRTEQSIRDFQTHHALEIDGELGPETARALDRALSALPPLTQADTGAEKPALRPKEQPQPEQFPVLSSVSKLVGSTILGLGDQSSAVQAIQVALTRLGYAINCSGCFDGATEAAVTDFQEQCAIEVDGEVGAETAAVIDRALAAESGQVGKPQGEQGSVLRSGSDTRPLWVIEGLKWLNVREVLGSTDNPIILKWAEEEGGMIADVFTHDSIPWCALFANMVLTKVGIKGTETLWALDWSSWGQKLPGPAVGAFAPMKRKGGGHIAIVIGRDKEGRLLCLGGNQNDCVNIAAVPAQRPVSFRWPANVPLPLKTGFNSLPLIGSKAQASLKEA